MKIIKIITSRCLAIFGLFAILLILTLTNASKSFAGVFFNIKNEEAPKTKIIFFGFDPAAPELKRDANNILEGIRKNLKTTDLFEIVKDSGNFETKGSEALNSNQISVEAVPDFERYTKAGIGAIVVAQLSYDIDGDLEMRIRMWDVLDQRQLFGKFYSSSKSNLRKMANIISDEIFKSITGEKKGHFNSKILYVAESGNLQKRIKRVAIMDFDGENRRILTDGSDLVLTPIFSRKADEIFYLRYFDNKPQIFGMDLRSGRSRKVGSFRATTFAASLHPKDSNVMLISAIFDGNSDIYEMNMLTNTAKRLTKSPAIETTAAYSADGKEIIFVSDRDSSQQIYKMSASGADIVKISIGSGSYSKPVWSPDGSMIAFTRIKNGQFYIGTMSPNGKNERLLTSSYLVEGAKWSPDGRYLIYSKKRGIYGLDGIPRLYIIDTTTGYEFEVPTPAGEGASDPDWVMY